MFSVVGSISGRNLMLGGSVRSVRARRRSQTTVRLTPAIARAARADRRDRVRRATPRQFRRGGRGKQPVRARAGYRLAVPGKTPAVRLVIAAIAQQSYRP
jgi:hypothetical protein